MLYSRDFVRRVGFGMLMHNAAKDAGGGSGGTQKPATVPELTQRIKDLEAENQSLTTQVSDANQAKTAAETAQKKAEGERDEANTAKDAALGAQQKAEKERDEANQAKTSAEQAKTKAEEDLKTADERAEQKLREIDAKNGGTLPPKKPGAGDHTQEKPVDQSLTPVQRLSAGFKVVGE